MMCFFTQRFEEKKLKVRCLEMQTGSHVRPEDSPAENGSNGRAYRESIPVKSC